MTPAALHKLYGILIALLVAVGSLAWWRHDVQVKAVQAYQLRTLDSTKTQELQAVATASQQALQAATQAEAAKSKALALVAAGKALQAHTDSVARQASNERDRAIQMGSDSATTLGMLRAEIGRLVSSGRADSGSAAIQHERDATSIRALLQVIARDSTALTASQAKSAALAALNATLGQEVKLLKASQPSKFFAVVKVVGIAAGAFELGHILK